MHRKLVYTFGLVGFFLMWGIFGFAAAVPRGEPDFQITVPPVDATSAAPSILDSEGIPVTGESAPVLAEIVVFYGLIGLTALFLILGLLGIANRSTAPDPKHKGTSSDEHFRQ